MAATTVNLNTRFKEGDLQAYPVKASTHIYKGTLVGLDTGGNLTNMADAASLIYVGVAYEEADNSSGAAGAKKCRVWKCHSHEFAYGGGDASQVKVGQEVYAQDNATVDEDASLTTNDWKVGVITEVESATKVWVRINGYTK